MKKSILFLCIALIVSLALSCSGVTRTLSASGSGTVTFVPDMAYLSLTVRNVAPSLASSLEKTSKAVNGMLALCKTYAVLEADILSSHVSTGKEYDRSVYNAPARFLGYYSTQSTRITVRDLKTFEKLSGDLLSLEAVSLDGVSFDHSKLSDYSSQADLLALDDAAASARKMAERMGVGIGTVLYISDTNESAIFDGDRFMDFAAKSVLRENSSGVTVSTGTMTATRNVRVVYQLK
jgi:uncharacterized protein